MDLRIFLRAEMFLAQRLKSFAGASAVLGSLAVGLEGARLDSPPAVAVGAGAGESLRRFSREELLAMVVTMPFISSSHWHSHSCM